MRNFISLITFLLLFSNSISFAQTPCSDIANIAAEVGIEAPGFEIDVANLEFEGGTCGTINYNGQEINGSSTVNFNVNIALGADELLCGTIDGNPPGIMDVINVHPSYSCEFNIMNVTGAMNAYLVTFDDNIPIEKIIKGTVNRTDLIQVYSPVATTIELPISVSATLVAIQSFCDPAESVAEAKADLTASVAGVSVNLTGVAKVEGGFLDNQYPSVSQVVSIPIYAGVRSFYMSLTGELSVRSRVLGLGDVIACGSNAVASADNSIDVGNFTGPNGGPFPEGMTIIGLNSGIDYVNPMEPLSCLNIPAPDIMVEHDSCGLGLGSATVTNSLDTLTYEWSNGQTGSSADMLNAGSYYCNVSTPSGCSRAFYVEIADSLQPNIILPTSVQLEDGDSLVLQATDNADPTLTYLWSTGETSPSITVSDEGIYSVNITTQETCVYEAATDIKLLTTCFDPCADCASFYFNESWDSTAVNLLGNAYLTDSSMVITDAINFQAGACWYAVDKQMLSQGFTSTFTFRISEGGGNQEGADGFAFVIQNSELNALGGSGGWMGYDGIPNGLAVEFDTYDNTPDNMPEPNGNHVSIQPSVNGTLSYYHPYSLGWETIPTDLIDGEIHQFRIHYDTDSLVVFFDNLETPIISVGINIYDLIENVNDGVWVGLTGATGGSYHKTEILSWNFNTLCSASCNDGIQNGNETAVDCGGDCSDCQCILIDEEYDIQCNTDGSYDISFSFTPQSDGSDYMVYDINDFFGELDTIYFTDDGSISELTYGPYMYGRDYAISMINLSDSTNCFTNITGDAPCTFNESCNLSATFSDECIGGNLVVSGTVTNGTGPYSIHSDTYSTVVFPDEGNTFEFTIPNCNAQSIDFTITDFNMCQYEESIIVNTEFPTNESSCLQSLTLHPNPVKSELYISFSEFCANSNIKIYDSLGQLIRSDILTGNSISYDVNALPKGVYFLYWDNEENRHVEKFIKI